MSFENLMQKNKSFLETQTELILESYRYWLDEDLIPPSDDPVRALFDTSQIVASANAAADPILNYGNQAALDLWEVCWDEFVQMPGRKTAEPMERAAREQFLQEVELNGFVKNYSGIRISKTGKRFEIKKATVWNLLDEDGNYMGQAATFSDYRYI